MMNMPFLRRAVAAATLVLGAVSTHAAVVYTFDATAVGAFGAGPYGTVTLTDTGANIDVSVDLRSDMNFVNTGGPHSVFSFNVLDAVVGDVSNILFNGSAPGANTFTVEAPGENQPFGTTFTMMVDCTGNACANGAPGQSIDPLTFTIANVEYTDFGGETLQGASFAADVICVTVGTNVGCNGATGAIGVTGPGGGDDDGGDDDAVPEPGSLALVGLALAGLGYSRRRRS